MNIFSSSMNFCPDGLTFLTNLLFLFRINLDKYPDLDYRKKPSPSWKHKSSQNQEISPSHSLTWRRSRSQCVGVSALLMRRCERPGLYFQTKFFCNHSQLFCCWSTLRCYVKTLRKDQRIINWKSLDRISTCQLKCMWPRLLTYWDI